MKEKDISVKRVLIINTLAIIVATAIAIILHAIVPGTGDLNIADFDSIFVKLFGFPVVAVSYFVLLFLHCVLVMRYFGKRSIMTKLQIGFRFGIVFAALYMVGMQEVVVEASPFNEWGLAFVNFQFFMGISDALPALLLCLVTAYLTLSNKNTSSTWQVLNLIEKMKVVALISITILIARAIGYETGLINSNIDTFPIPAYLWTIVFGVVLGCCYTVLYPIFDSGKNKSLLSYKLVVVTIGLNWIIFNSFIGLIFSGVMYQMLLRSGIDIAVFFIASIIIQRYILKSDIRAS
ncbi:hypothetical protein AWH56_021995 [Anaerobacillus isosaccharinicus]|uniref:Uncharacterized protein n=1 Tax=Anaerobacillus isosaccharinicus TaxID=1532552 RepID=A0A1S2MDY2_9BACI|nr:hypothetical protein [Anaerobacillus isosaccharinicus]MBA5586423.1 hypothetical protein [Anaerobacillus isosaccharinicus]QOY35334.1 hypothetical protein AWH56_021995 [Anaerobacillus isosaccharinicus]